MGKEEVKWFEAIKRLRSRLRKEKWERDSLRALNALAESMHEGVFGL